MDPSLNIIIKARDEATATLNTVRANYERLRSMGATAKQAGVSKYALIRERMIDDRLQQRARELAGDQNMVRDDERRIIERQNNAAQGQGGRGGRDATTAFLTRAATGLYAVRAMTTTLNALAEAHAEVSEKQLKGAAAVRVYATAVVSALPIIGGAWQAARNWREEFEFGDETRQLQRETEAQERMIEQLNRQTAAARTVYELIAKNAEARERGRRVRRVERAGPEAVEKERVRLDAEDSLKQLAKLRDEALKTSISGQGRRNLLARYAQEERTIGEERDRQINQLNTNREVAEEKRVAELRRVEAEAQKREQDRLAELARTANERLADDIERIKIDALENGVDKRLALIEFEYDRERRLAAEHGADLALVDEKFRLRREQAAIVAVTKPGGPDPRAPQAAGYLNPASSPFLLGISRERATLDTAKNTANISKSVREQTTLLKRHPVDIAIAIITALGESPEWLVRNN